MGGLVGAPRTAETAAAAEVGPAAPTAVAAAEIEPAAPTAVGGDFDGAAGMA